MRRREVEPAAGRAERRADAAASIAVPRRRSCAPAGTASPLIVLAAASADARSVASALRQATGPTGRGVVELADRAAIALENARLIATLRSRSTSGAVSRRCSRTRPPQGRVPGDARPRAAQPAGADPQRRRGAAPRRPTSPSRPGRARRDRAARSTHLARLVDDLLDVAAHQPGQDRSCSASRWTCGAVVAQAVETRRPLIEARRPPARRRRCPQSRCWLRRRPDAAGAGRRQPAQQRRQVHRRRRAASSWPLSGEGDEARGRRARQRHRHRRRTCCRASSTCSRRRERSLDRSAGRPGHRPDAGAAAGRAARRHGRGAQRRPGRGQRVRGAPAAADARSATARRRAATRVRAGGRARAAASWWSTTTSTRPRALAVLLRAAAVTRSRRPTTAARRWRRRGCSRPTSCCWTSACRGWTATRWRGACARSPETRGVVLVALTGYGQPSRPPARARGRLRPPPHQARRPRCAARAGRRLDPVVRGAARGVRVAKTAGRQRGRLDARSRRARGGAAARADGALLSK